MTAHGRTKATDHSLKRITANQQKARMSTGPRTEEGKRQSRRNAFRHGLTAETTIDPLEDMEDYKAFEATIVADYDARWLMGSPNGRAHSAAEEHADSAGRPLGRANVP